MSSYEPTSEPIRLLWTVLNPGPHRWSCGTQNKTKSCDCGKRSVRKKWGRGWEWEGSSEAGKE